MSTQSTERNYRPRTEASRQWRRDYGGSTIALGKLHHCLECEPDDPGLSYELDLPLTCQHFSHRGGSPSNDTEKLKTRVHLYTATCEEFKPWYSHRLSLRKVELNQYIRNLSTQESVSVDPTDDTGNVAGMEKDWMKKSELKERFYKHVRSKLSATLSAAEPTSLRDKVAAAKRLLNDQTVPDDWDDGLSDPEDEKEMQEEA